MISSQEAVACMWNDASFITESRIIPDLHEKFKTKLDLSKPEGATITAEKVKTTMTLIKPKMFGVMFNYEKSGNRSGQKNEDDLDRGKLSLEECVYGGNRANFLPNRNKDWCLFHWWAALDEMQLLNFTLVRLPNFMKANSDTHTLISRNRET